MATLVGLTGGIGTGKSRVSELLREMGAAVECSDLIVRELQAPGGAGLAQIVAAFGEDYLTAKGELDRVKLGALVFNDVAARTQLGSIMHPLVYQTLQARTEVHRANGFCVLVQDIPLLLEGRRAGTGSGAKTPFDLVCLVYASPAQQLARVMERDDLDRAAAQARIDSQMSIDEKRAMADVIIENTGEWEATVIEVKKHYDDWATR